MRGDVSLPTVDAVKLIYLLLLAMFASATHAQEKLVEYRLGPGDGIRISVFQNPNLTLDTRLAEDGAISYPLIGRVKIGGETLAGAEGIIARALEAGNYIQSPQVTIVLMQARSSQVSVLGLVNRAGRFPLETLNTRVSEMIAMAGGIAREGADFVILTGARNGKYFRKEIDVAALFLSGKHEDDVLVAGGDVIYVQRAPQFYVYGEVNRPGAYRVERGMTIRQALVQGGGPTQRGTERNLRLYRRGATGELEASSPRLSEPVRADDVLYVGESLF